MFILIDGLTSFLISSSFPDKDVAGRIIEAPGLDWKWRTIYIAFTVVEYIPLWYILLPAKRDKQPSGL
jgi:hypothetical protein